jgi:ribosomal protein S18 acetylase RimI-like enzyme
MVNQNVLDDCCSYLKKVKYKNILQELKLEHCTDEHGDYIYLVCIKIKKSQKEKGYGTAVLSEVIKLADEHNVRIILYATNIFGADLNRLYAFYIKHGFVLIKKKNDGKMIYQPKKKEIKL